MKNKLIKRSFYYFLFVVSIVLVCIQWSIPVFAFTPEWTDETKNDVFGKTWEITKGTQKTFQIGVKEKSGILCVEGCDDNTVSGPIHAYDSPQTHVPDIQFTVLKTAQLNKTYTAKFKAQDTNDLDNSIYGTFTYKIVESAPAPIPSDPSKPVIPPSTDNLCATYKSPAECKKHSKACLYVSKNNLCISTLDLKACAYVTDEKECKDVMEVCEYIDGHCAEKKISGSGAGSTQQIDASAAVDTYLKDKYKEPENYEGPLKGITCAWSGSCRNVGSLVQVFINIGEMIFGLVAGIAFVFFVYGGFTMMLSFGNAEKVKKGQQILVAAVVGLIIVFSSYILIDFLLDALGVVGSFRGIDLK